MQLSENIFQTTSKHALVQFPKHYSDYDIEDRLGLSYKDYHPGIPWRRVFCKYAYLSDEDRMLTLQNEDWCWITTESLPVEEPETQEEDTESESDSNSLEERKVIALESIAKSLERFTSAAVKSYCGDLYVSVDAQTYKRN